MAYSKSVVFTSLPVVLPADFNPLDNTIYAYPGAGGPGYGELPGGGGGAIAWLLNYAGTPGATVTSQIGVAGTSGTSGSVSGTAGTDTWLVNTSTLLAKAGQPGTSANTAPLGGQASACVGTGKFSGGNGGIGVNAAGGGSGGASASPTGAGANGATGTSTGAVGGASPGAGAGGLGAPITPGTGNTSANNGVSNVLGGGGGGGCGETSGGAGVGGDGGFPGGAAGAGQFGTAGGTSKGGQIVVSYNPVIASLVWDNNAMYRNFLVR